MLKLNDEIEKLQNEMTSQMQEVSQKLSQKHINLVKREEELHRAQLKQQELEQRLEDLDSQLRQRSSKIQELEGCLKRREDNKNNPFQVEQTSSIVRDRSRTPNRSILISREEKADLNQSKRDILNDSFVDRKNELAHMISCFEQKRKEYEEYKRVTDQRLSDRSNELIALEKKKDIEIIRLETTIQHLRASQSILTAPKQSSLVPLYVSLLMLAAAAVLAFTSLGRCSN